MELVLARLPAPVVADVRTALRIVEKEVGRPPEVLLAMRIVALRPVVDGRVADRAERCLVAIQHELMVGELAL